jgi:hypothetical protein
MGAQPPTSRGSSSGARLCLHSVCAAPRPALMPMPTCKLTLSTPCSAAPQLDSLSSEVEQLRGAVRAMESALADYKAGRCPYATLRAALDRGQRNADRTSSLRTELEVRRGGKELLPKAKQRRETRPAGGMRRRASWARVCLSVNGLSYVHGQCRDGWLRTGGGRRARWLCAPQNMLGTSDGGDEDMMGR